MKQNFLLVHFKVPVVSGRLSALHRCKVFVIHSCFVDQLFNEVTIIESVINWEELNAEYEASGEKLRDFCVR